MPGSKRICRQCLNDDRYLNNIIASDPDASESCDYCDSEEMTMSMETLAEKVDWLIENYYRGGEYNHYLEEYEGEPLFSVLEQEVTANDNIIDDLSELLEELWFDWSSHDRKYGDEPHFVEAVTISGNLSRKNAISEVRPPVGSYVAVAVAEFTLLRTVRLLDLSSLKGLAVNGFSRFDPEYLLRYERSSFIQNLSRKLVLPVVPELEETNYLLTQAIADYLSTFEHCELDGILFASAQKPKESTDPSVMNIILFHKSSGVLNADRRFREAEVNMYQHDEDISYFDPEIRTTPDDFRREFKVLSRKKNREDILELKLDGIEVHKIEGVDYSTSETAVTHYLTEGRTKGVISHAKSGYSDDEF
ncbi:RES family NAD+ phosphorylase [Salmonella enterica]|nr:RES family NAD+ phosphorylase [Salmonella enterica]EMD4062923.1 RES family NAD+ phosphorylase [Salmonella enterica]EMD4103762.1 RES family NAD+ phosphorylase [Salmonella enterica]EMD4121955.1 RES family NAD+ phosphorylase [Salmonella enterica]EMD4298205.1 RES family NAD+ phosphorylase [Salmonella enterica]